MFQAFKLVFRIGHMLSTTVLAGFIILNYFFELNVFLKDKPGYKALHIVAGLTLFITGISNIFFIKAGKKLKKEHKMWVHFFELKFLLAILLTPAIVS